MEMMQSDWLSYSNTITHYCTVAEGRSHNGNFFCFRCFKEVLEMLLDKSIPKNTKERALSVMRLKNLKIRPCELSPHRNLELVIEMLDVKVPMK